MRSCALLRLAAVLSLLAIASSCAHKGQNTAEVGSAEVVMPEEKLGIGDVFEVRVVSEPDLSGTFRVSTDGTVDYPFAGRLQVLGLKPNDLQELITNRLKDGYVRSPQVSVMVKEWNSRKITVLGQVPRPGPVPYVPQMTIVDALAAAGGFTPVAAKNSVKVRREQNGKVQTHTYPVEDISEGRSPNVVLLPGDVVVVDERIF